MIVPDKVFKFRDTTISKMLLIIAIVEIEDKSIRFIYEQTKEKFDGIDDFIYSLDVLFILNKIEIEWKDGIVKYVKGD